MSNIFFKAVETHMRYIPRWMMFRWPYWDDVWLALLTSKYVEYMCHELVLAKAY